MPDGSHSQQIQSEALSRNMNLTRVEVIVPSLFSVLTEAVKGYAGKEQQTRELLVEYHHRFRNWEFVVQEAWRYAVSNIRLYRQHPLNGGVIYLLSHILLEALRTSEQPDVRSTASDHLLAFWLKLCDEMPEAVSAPAPEGFSVEQLDLEAESITTCHQGIFRHFFTDLTALPEERFAHLLRSFYQPKRLARRLLKLWPDPEPFTEFRAFLERALVATYTYWLTREDPCTWLAQQDGDCVKKGEWIAHCAPLGHARFEDYMAMLKKEIEPEPDHRVAVEKLADLLDYHEVVRLYFKLPDDLKIFDDPSRAIQLSLLMRLKIMETRGLEGIHEETLREINFDVSRWFKHEHKGDLEQFLKRILEVLQGCLNTYPEAALQILRTIGLAVLDTDDRRLVEFFIRRTISMGFQTPELGGVSQHWQIAVNPAHLSNVRVWLEIIKKDPSRTRTLLSALIVNLMLGGIYVRDTDLFQKDVSQILHAPIKPVYNLVKQLTKVFPVYFNQIGAEGNLRNVSTDVDELTGRSDKLIHFLRKQSHVESNNIVVSFIESIIDFWRTLDKSKLKELLPDEVYPEVVSSGPLVDDVHRIFVAVFTQQTIHNVKDLLDLSEARARELIWAVPDIPDRERQRAYLIIQFYQMLHEKYALSFKDIDVHLQRALNLGLPDPMHLLDALKNGDNYSKLEAILEYLMQLKEVILTPGEMVTIENIYYKRHIAVDIPSMYGSYNERKFDALGLTFRLENLANVLFEEIILSFNLSFITKATFFRIGKFIPLFIKALAIDGITSNRLEREAELFEKAIGVRRFSHSQYMDIFRGFSEAIKQIIQTNYHTVHEENLETVIRLLGESNLIPRYLRGLDNESAAERNQRVSETFLRDIIARTFGLQYFDHFISSILTTLATQKEHLSIEDLDLLLSYDPERTLSLVQAPVPRTYDLIHLGNKGYTLAKLHEIGIQVPPAFVITTEYFRCRAVIDSFHQSTEDFEDRVMMYVRRLERETGRRFGDPSKPLLLSVRSGAAVSMPGMMNTFLNVGINETVVEGLIKETGEAWFAWDNYRRFIQSWAMSFGILRDEFDALMVKYKKRYSRHVKREFSPLEIRELSLAYKEKLKTHGVAFSDDPKEQLFTAIRQVVESWYSEKAHTYREIMGISENWGSAVTIQAMVYGNLDTTSGAGVMFTHNPRTYEDHIEPMGDFTLGNQGEDVVGGLVQTLPLSEKQRKAEGARKEYSLESLFPLVFRRLDQIARELVETQNWSPQEIEFTFQGNTESGVYILQSRNMTPRIRRSYPVFSPSEALHESHVGSGIGVSGGALSGIVAFDFETLRSLRTEKPGKPIILIRSDTVPDDIREIAMAEGLLTGKGGATSHAAIVAHRLGKSCVVGFSKLRVWESDKRAVIDGHTLRTGDVIGIDGRSGAVYIGEHPIEQVEVY